MDKKEELDKLVGKNVVVYHPRGWVEGKLYNGPLLFGRESYHYVVGLTSQAKFSFNLDEVVEIKPQRAAIHVEV